jgi:hypothetical protein
VIDQAIGDHGAKLSLDAMGKVSLAREFMV